VRKAASLHDVASSDRPSHWCRPFAARTLPKACRAMVVDVRAGLLLELKCSMFTFLARQVEELWTWLETHFHCPEV
jgi:hypothetical protein